ncbi:MAG: hydrogenase nickel incorporation protein HypA [archaeon]
MHEWALAEAVVRTADDFAEKKGLKRITKIAVELGKLQQISTETFRFAITQGIRPESKVTKKTKITIRQKGASMKCRNCQKVWSPKGIKGEMGEEISEAIHFIPEMAHAFMKCPKCGSHDFEVIGGRGVSVLSIKGTK